MDRDETRSFHASSDIDIRVSTSVCCLSCSARSGRSFPAEGKYANNTIRTTKYSLLSFLPLNLFEQVSSLTLNFCFNPAFNKVCDS